jgi:hypothetical protein
MFRLGVGATMLDWVYRPGVGLTVSVVGAEVGAIAGLGVFASARLGLGVRVKSPDWKLSIKVGSTAWELPQKIVIQVESKIYYYTSRMSKRTILSAVNIPDEHRK